MRVACIGDIIGRPGTKMLEVHLKKIREDFGVDFVIANGENASHGFGINPVNALELFGYGVDCITGGNHSFDKKEIFEFLKQKPQILRPDNYPPEVPGCGIYITEVCGERLAVVNILGNYAMPSVENCFRWTQQKLKNIEEMGIKSIIIDFHAETTSEKRSFFMLFKERVSAIFGTHTHVGTDDLTIESGCGYITDIGLTGCRDNVIGMDAKSPLDRFLTGMPARYDVPEKCKKILQFVIFEIESGHCKNAKKIRIYEGTNEYFTQNAFMED